MRNGRREEEMIDDLFETMLLVMLCLAISTLLYIRNRWERRRREEEEKEGKAAGANASREYGGRGMGKGDVITNV